MLPVYDLHCHSNCSDGSLSPKELVARAHSQGVTHLALTDHDCVAGISEARNEAESTGLQVLAGIELSTQWRGRGIHIVGLNIDETNDELIKAIEAQTRSRVDRAKQICDRLADKGYEGCFKGARKYASSDAIGRPHIASYLVEIGAVASHAQAFKRYLGAGKIGDIKQCWPDIDTAIEWIHRANGHAVVAHPTKYTMTRTKLRTLLGEFEEAGGDAMEVVCGWQKPGLAEDMQRLASAFSLASSCGSDFHSPGRPWQELGAFARLPTNARPVWDLWGARA